MRVDRLLEIAEKIEEYPEHFDMNTWHGGMLGPLLSIAHPTACGTTHCIAGWAEVLYPEVRNKWKSTLMRAMCALDLDSEQKERLFYTESWPDQLRGPRRYRLNFAFYQPTASDAAARIRHFIATNGKE